MILNAQCKTFIAKHPQAKDWWVPDWEAEGIMRYDALMRVQQICFSCEARAECEQLGMRQQDGIWGGYWAGTHNVRKKRHRYITPRHERRPQFPKRFGEKYRDNDTLDTH